MVDILQTFRPCAENKKDTILCYVKLISPCPTYRKWLTFKKNQTQNKSRMCGHLKKVPEPEMKILASKIRYKLI